MKPNLRGLIVLGLFAVVAVWSGAAQGEQAPPEPGATSVEAAKTGAAAKTAPAKTAPAAKTAASASAEAEGQGTWATVSSYVVAIFTYPLTIAMFIIIASYALGRVLGRRLRMPDFSWKIGLVAFTVIASGFISWVGISNAVVRIQRGKPSGAELKFGIDLRGGVDLIYQIKQREKDDPNLLIDALRKRIDPNGTKQIVVRLSGADQVEIIVPDVNEDEVAEIKRNVTDLGTLEFRILANRRDSRHLALGKIALDPDQTPATKKELTRYADEPDARPEARWVPLDPDIVEQYYRPRKDADGANAADGPRDYRAGMFTRVVRGNEPAAKDTPLSDLIEPNSEGGWKYKGNYRVEILVFQDSHDVTGGYLSNVSGGVDEHLNPAVNFAFDAEGSSRFTSLTTEFAPPDRSDEFRWHLAVILNGRVSSAPSLNSVISGNGQITGYRNNETGVKERDRVISVLKAGRLPAQLYETPLREFRMDSTLGMDTIWKSVWSMCVALGLVFLFMLVYYRFSGVVACIALLLNLLLLVGSMIAIGAALTLPGFAGMVLTVGMAVDSNVLIYERIREEIARGAALRMAIRNGFGKALSAIIDGNLTTILTAIILYAIGTEQLRGFAVTLILGLMISMFTAVFCSRLIFDVAERRRWLTEVRMLKFFEKTNFDFLAVKWPAITASLVIILLGFVAVYARGKGLYDIEFTGGTAAQVVLNDRGASLTLEETRRRLEQWNQTIDDTSDADLPKALELSSRPEKQKLARTLEIELLASQADREQDATVRAEKKAQADALRRKRQLVGDELSPADEKLLKEFYDSLGPDEMKEFRKLARLDDLTVTLVRIGEDERRPYVNTSNSSQPAVEGILEKVFEGQLASKSFEMELVQASATSSGSSTTEKPADVDKTGANKAGPGKTPEAKTEATKKPAESSKTPDKGKTETGKTEGGKTDAGKTGPGQKTSSLLSPREPSWVAFTAVDDDVLLAQAEPPGKTTDAATPPQDAPGKDASAKSPAVEAEPGKLAPVATAPAVQFNLKFIDKISHVTVESAIRKAARNVLAPGKTAEEVAKDPRVQAVIESIKVTSRDYVEEVNNSLDTWTASINAPESTARQVLVVANSMLQEEPLFPATNNFGSLVSKKMQVDAIVAIVASWIGILIYLWVRFQKVSFGLAAVVALIHDVLVALAFMAFSYWLTGIPFIDPFKINLDVVAAFLTLIGYSVNDTIVIFDRIREIKGKSPDLTAEMINRAVNETLSRTIITSGLTFLVVVAQFFFGGQSIHAFAFCLVVGLIAGTYSTIYIASPVLLWSSRRSQKKGRFQTAPSRQPERVKGA